MNGIGSDDPVGGMRKTSETRLVTGKVTEGAAKAKIAATHTIGS
jgi:hypothetical protein